MINGENSGQGVNLMDTEISVSSVNSGLAGNSGGTVTRSRGRPFTKGLSGNPRGRPRRDHDVAALARGHATASIATLASIMADPSTPPATRVMAANALLDRGYGRAPQALELNHMVTLADEFEAYVRRLTTSGQAG
jgi:hypothetical protein